MTITRLLFEEYHFLNECNIIANNIKKRICCCSYNKNTDKSYYSAIFYKDHKLENTAKFANIFQQHFFFKKSSSSEVSFYLLICYFLTKISKDFAKSKIKGIYKKE